MCVLKLAHSRTHPTIILLGIVDPMIRSPLFIMIWYIIIYIYIVTYIYIWITMYTSLHHVTVRHITIRSPWYSHSYYDIYVKRSASSPSSERSKLPVLASAGGNQLSGTSSCGETRQLTTHGDLMVVFHGFAWVLHGISWGLMCLNGNLYNMS